MPINPDKLTQQIYNQRDRLVGNFDKLQQHVKTALAFFQEAAGADLERLARDNKTDRALAYPHTDLTEKVDIGIAPTTYTVIGTDASSIPPDRHGGTAMYYVINIGQVMLSYGPNSLAEIDNETFFQAGDVASEEGREVSAGLLLDVESAVKELERGLVLARQHAANLVFRDGPLTLWNSITVRGGRGAELRKEYYQRLDDFKRSEPSIPIVGYISNTHSDAVLNSLRAWAKERDPQASRLSGVQDAMLFGEWLGLNQRSAIFKTKLHEPRELAEYIDTICFTYIRTPNEVVRVEFPEWLADDLPALDHALAIVLRQIELGQGYPVVLMEAHESAVLRQADRTLLRLLLEENGLLMAESEKGRSKRLRGL